MVLIMISGPKDEQSESLIHRVALVLERAGNEIIYNPLPHSWLWTQYGQTPYEIQESQIPYDEVDALVLVVTAKESLGEDKQRYQNEMWRVQDIKFNFVNYCKTLGKTPTIYYLEDISQSRTCHWYPIDTQDGVLCWLNHGETIDDLRNFKQSIGQRFSTSAQFVPYGVAQTIASNGHAQNGVFSANGHTQPTMSHPSPILMPNVSSQSTAPNSSPFRTSNFTVPSVIANSYARTPDALALANTINPDAPIILPTPEEIPRVYPQRVTINGFYVALVIVAIVGSMLLIGAATGYLMDKNWLLSILLAFATIPCWLMVLLFIRDIAHSRKD